MKAWSPSAASPAATARDCRCASAAKPSAVTSGTQICTGRRPCARSRARCARTRLREPVSVTASPPPLHVTVPTGGRESSVKPPGTRPKRTPLGMSGCVVGARPPRAERRQAQATAPAVRASTFPRPEVTAGEPPTDYGGRRGKAANAHELRRQRLQTISVTHRQPTDAARPAARADALSLIRASVGPGLRGTGHVRRGRRLSRVAACRQRPGRVCGYGRRP